MNIVLVKVIFALLTFITTNPTIPQSVKDQSIDLVSQTAISAPQAPLAACTTPILGSAPQTSVLDNSTLNQAKDESFKAGQKAQVQSETDLFKAITTDPGNLQLGMDLCDVNTAYWGKLGSFDTVCKAFNAKYR